MNPYESNIDGKLDHLWVTLLGLVTLLVVLLLLSRFYPAWVLNLFPAESTGQVLEWVNSWL